MTKIRNLFTQSALAAVLAIGAANVAHADISVSTTSIGGPSSNGPSAGNSGNSGNNGNGSTSSNTSDNSTDGVGTSTNNGVNGPDVFTYDTKLPNKPRLPKIPLLPKKPCHGSQCKAQTVSTSVDGKVCFYTGANFTGAHFCASIGTSAPSLPARWNDRIASIEITGPVSAKVCSDRGYSGQCLVIDGSHARLFTLNGEISSYRVQR